MTPPMSTAVGVQVLEPQSALVAQSVGCEDGQPPWTQVDEEALSIRAAGHRSGRFEMRASESRQQTPEAQLAAAVQSQLVSGGSHVAAPHSAVARRAQHATPGAHVRAGSAVTGQLGPRRGSAIRASQGVASALPPASAPPPSPPAPPSGVSPGRRHTPSLHASSASHVPFG